MTWSDIAPFSGAVAKTVPQAVMLSATKPDGRFRHALWISLRPSLWPDGAPTWIAHGQLVSVQLGSGAEAGQIRLVPGGRFKIGQLTRHTEVLKIAVPALPTMPKAKQPPIACEFDWTDDWVAITLPAWCRPRPAVPQPALSPNAERAARAA